MPTASIKPLDNAVEVRIHDEGGYGSDWQWGCVVAPKEPGSDTAWITLAIDAPTTSQRRELMRALVDLGYTHMQWERIKDGQRRMTRPFELES